MQRTRGQVCQLWFSRGVAVVDFDLIVASFFLPGGWCVVFAINIGM